MQRPIRKDWTFAAAVVAVAIIFWGATGMLRLSHAMHHDFLAFYVGGTLARQGHHQDLYDTGLQMRVQREVAPELKVLVPYIRPPVFAALFSPFTLLSLRAAFAVWIAMQIAALVVAGWWVARRFGSDGLVYFSFFQPALIAIFNGQDSAILLLFVILAYILLERGRDLAAGAVLGLLLMKFHLLFLLPLALLTTRRFRMLAGVAGTGLAYAASWLLMVGPVGIEGYVRVLTRKDLENLEPQRFWMPNLRGIATDLDLDFALVSIVVGAVLVWTVWAVRRAPLWQWLGVTLIASMLVAPHAYPYDVTPLLPFALFAVFGDTRRFTKFAAATMVLPLPYLVVWLGPPVAVVMPLVIFAAVVSLALDPLSQPAVLPEPRAVAQPEQA